MNPIKTSNRFAPLAELGGRMPEPPKKKAEPVFGGKYSGNQLGQMRAKLRELYPDHSMKQRASPEMEGRALKRLGKELGNKSYIDQGRKLHYGKLSPEQLLTQHPSAFLRQYTIRSAFLQHSENPLRAESEEHGFNQPASADMAFHLVSNQGSDQLSASRIEGDKIFDARNRRMHKRKQDFNLVQSEHVKPVEDMAGKGKVHFGPEMRGGFLPMLQSKQGTLEAPASEENVHAFERGKLDMSTLTRRSHPVFTTELTGCSVVRLNNSLAHIRPDADAGGEALHRSFTSKQSYGRMDYPTANNAFVMLRKKPGGKTKLYYQTHHDDGHSISGSRYLSKPKY